MIDLNALRDAIRAQLKATTTPQTQIARELGISQSWISLFINERINSPRLDRLMRLAKWAETDKSRSKGRKAA